MAKPVLHVLSLRYSSWSMRAWLALRYAGLGFETRTVTLENLGAQSATEDRAQRRALGSATGCFPVLHLGDARIHESLAIAEWAAEARPEARLWPTDELERARARAAACEMASGFPNLRSTMSCHVFARVPEFTPSAATQAEIERVFELWDECLERSGGPLLFGQFTIADAMYFPVVTRFRTYGVALPGLLEAYASELEAHPTILAWKEMAQSAPRIPRYDQYIVDLGGDPDAVKPG